MIQPTCKSLPYERRRPHKAGRARGFTLIEILIVVAIIGILAAIAYPSYGSYVTKTRRTDAQLSLLEARQAMERCRSTTYTYVSCELPRDGASVEGEYDLTLTPAATPTTFTIVATPKTGGRQVGDTECAQITINHLDEAKGFDSSAAASAVCWN